jgi:outer membrane lipoprotein-sorting protein
MIRKNLAGKGLIGIVLAGLVSTTAWAQTADELIEKNIQAKGGREKLQAIKTLRMSGKMGMGQGMEAPITMELSRPDKMRLEFVVQGMTGVQTYDGNEAWALMPFMGKTDPEQISGKQLDSVKEQADFDGILVDYKQKGHQVELVGKEDLEGTPAYKLKVTKKNGDVGYYWLDAESYLDLKASGKTNVNGQDIEGETYFGDYKESGGVLFAHSIENKAVGMPGSMTITIEKIEVNPDLAAERFSKPQAAKPAGAAKP